MLGSYDFMDDLHAIFQAKGALKERHLSSFSKYKLFVQERNIAMYNVSCPNIYDFSENILRLKTKLSSLDIEMEAVFDGIIDIDPSSLFTPYFVFSRIMEQFFVMRNVFKTIMADFIATHYYSILIISSFQRCAKDSFVLSCYKARLRDRMIYALGMNNIPIVMAPQTIEAQMNYFYSLNPARTALCGSPLLLLFSEAKEVIAGINLFEETCSVFQLETLSQQFKCKPEVLKRCLLGSFFYFQCHPSKSRISKLETAFQNTLQDFPSDYDFYRAKNVDLICSHIELLKDKVNLEETEEEFCYLASEVLELDLEELLSIYQMYKNPPIFRTENSTFSFPEHKEELSKYILDFKNDKLLNWTCRNFIFMHMTSLFNRFTNYTTNFYFPKIECVEVMYMYQVYFREKLAIAASNIAEVVGFDRSIVPKANFFNEKIVDIPLKEVDDFHLLNVNFEGSVTFNSTIQNLICQSGTNITNISDGQRPPSVRDALRYVYLSLMRDLLYINVKEKSLLVPGVSFLILEDCSMEEEIIYAFELIRTGVLAPKPFKSQLTKDRDQADRIDRLLIKLLSSNSFSYDPNLVKFNYDYFGKKTWSRKNTPANLLPNTHFIENDSQNSYSENIDEVKSDSETTNFQIEFMINILYKALHNFKKKYLAFHENKKCEADVHEILENAFRNRGLCKTLFATRILSLCVTNYHISTIFDIDVHQFIEAFILVKKSLQSMMSSYLFLFCEKTGSIYDFEFVKQVTQSFPLCKIYSMEFGIVMKIVFTKFLIYQVLKKQKDPYAEIFAQQLRPENLTAKYKLNFDIVKALQQGKHLYDKLFTMIQTALKYTDGKVFKETAESLTSSFVILRDLLNFFLLEDT